MDADVRTGQGKPSGLLPTAHNALLVSAVMVPVTGVMVRYVQYSTWATLPDTIRLAVSAPLPELAGRGFVTVLFIGSILAYVEYVLAREPRPSTSARRSRSSLRLLVFAVAALIVVSALAFLVAGMLFLALTLVGAFAAVLLGQHRRRRGAWSDRFALGALCLIYLTAGATAGLASSPPPAAYVTFADVPNSPHPGWYLELGHSGEAVFLTPCSDRGHVLELPASRVELMDWPPPTPNDLSRRLADLESRSLYARCP